MCYFEQGSASWSFKRKRLPVFLFYFKPSPQIHYAMYFNRVENTYFRNDVICPRLLVRSGRPGHHPCLQDNDCRMKRLKKLLKRPKVLVSVPARKGRVSAQRNCWRTSWSTRPKSWCYSLSCKNSRRCGPVKGRIWCVLTEPSCFFTPMGRSYLGFVDAQGG